MPFPKNPTTNFRDSNQVDLGDKLVTKDYLLEVYGSILESSPASGLVVTPQLWVWGTQGNGFELGTGDNTARSTPSLIGGGGTNWKQVSCGTVHQGAVKTDGTLWMWGPPSSGALGPGASSNVPVTTFAGGTTWKQVSCSRDFTAAVKTDGTLWTWGRNTEGQLGINAAGDRSTPVTTFVGGNNWKSVSAASGLSSYHVAAIKTDGSLWTWGRNHTGQLGINDTTNRNTPVTTFAGGNTWKQVYCGGYNTAAVKTDGTLWIWGFSGQLGINAAGQKNTPVTTFAGGTTWKQTTTNMAIKTDGSLWVWGSNGAGQLGTNDTITKSTPVTTFAGGTNWKSVAFGDGHATAIKTDGTLWVWGINGNNQLGINATGNRSTPVTTFVGGNNWKQVTAGWVRTAAIQSIDYI